MLVPKVPIRRSSAGVLPGNRSFWRMRRCVSPGAPLQMPDALAVAPEIVTTGLPVPVVRPPIKAFSPALFKSGAGNEKDPKVAPPVSGAGAVGEPAAVLAVRVADPVLPKSAVVE